VLVPPDTKLQFFRDAGQSLVLPGTDYDSVAKELWDQLKEEGDPIGPKGVTYNYKLTPDKTEEHRENAEAADWGAGAEVYFLSSGDAYLCQGTADTCPTPKLNVAASRHDELVAKGDAALQAFKDMLAAGSSELPPEIADFAPRLADVPANMHQYVADGVPDDRWKHHCDGILHQFGGAGNEILWLACSSISVRVPGRRQMPTLDTADVTGPGFGDETDWVPADEDYTRIRQHNQQAVKDTENKGTISIVAGGMVVLIGPGHRDQEAGYVRRQGDIEEGQIAVTKGGAFSKGEIKVNGISAKQALVKQEIGEFSDKKVTFV
jgi:hypothetical protein